MLVGLLLKFAYFACESLEVILHPNEVLLDLWLNQSHENQGFVRLCGRTLGRQRLELGLCFGRGRGCHGKEESLSSS
jgi:hypothetical protein